MFSTTIRLKKQDPEMEAAAPEPVGVNNAL